MIDVFISYARKDRPLRDELVSHLSLLRRQRMINDWHDESILPGLEWKSEISLHLKASQIIILLISADFMASDFCYSKEMQNALVRHRQNQARVIPILLRPTDFEGSPFEALQMLPKNGKPLTKWLDRDETWFDITKEIQKAIHEINHTRASSPLSRPEQEQIWNVPHGRNGVFTGREDVLTHLYQELRQFDHLVALTQPQTKSGIGGIGKTQVALEYAYRHRDVYRYVLWANADTQEELTSSFVTIAELLDLPEKNKKDQHIIVSALKEWLTTQTDWLLILDSVEEPGLIEEFIPPNFKGHILLTTREPQIRKLASCLDVDAMTLGIGALFLLRRAAILKPSENINESTQEERFAAEQIVQEVEGLPLAIDQAGAYIEATGCELADYLKLYQKQRDFLRQSQKQGQKDFAPTASTWSLAFEKIERKNPATADLLRLCSFLHHDTIPEEIFVKNVIHLSQPLQMITDSFIWNRVCEIAQTYSLLNRNKKNNTLSIHRTVQELLREQMDIATQQAWAERVIKIVDQTFPHEDIHEQNWAECERVLPQTLECLKLSTQWKFTSEEAFDLCNNAATYLMQRTRYEEAERLFMQALSLYEPEAKSSTPTLAGVLRKLAQIYEQQNNFDRAETFYQRALELLLQLFGKDHPSTKEVEEQLKCVHGKMHQD